MMIVQVATSMYVSLYYINTDIVLPPDGAKCLQDIAYLRSGDKGDNCNIGESRFSIYNL